MIDAAVRRLPYVHRVLHLTTTAECSGLGGGNVRLRNYGRPNGLEVNPRGQGPRAEAAAARRLPAFEARDAGGVTPFKYR
jgi:hypothetical protein